jgi:hypothetical protein
MKKYLRYFCQLLLLTTIVSADQLPEDLQRLIDRRADGVAKIDTVFVGELEKLKIKYTKAGDLDAANAVVALIQQTPIKVVDAAPADAEFEGTTWAFHNKGGKLGEIELLAGGKIKSQQYPKASWKRIDKDTLRYQYGDEPDDHVLFRFQDDTRTRMQGNQSKLGTPRYLYKLK